MPSGCMAEQMSWVKPGNVSSADRVPPPIVLLASNTITECPSRANVTAAASPFGPDPIMTASYIGFLHIIFLVCRTGGFKFFYINRHFNLILVLLSQAANHPRKVLSTPDFVEAPRDDMTQEP